MEFLGDTSDGWICGFFTLLVCWHLADHRFRGGKTFLRTVAPSVELAMTGHHCELGGRGDWSLGSVEPVALFASLAVIGHRSGRGGRSGLPWWD